MAPEPPRPCVVIPVYNHGLTVGRIIDEGPARVAGDRSRRRIDRFHPGCARPRIPRHRCPPLPQSGQGRRVARRIRARARAWLHPRHHRGRRRQHPTDALAEFTAACHARPEAFVVGVRALKTAGAPRARRWSNALSTFWFQFETGVPLTDTPVRVPVLSARSDHGLGRGLGTVCV